MLVQHERSCFNGITGQRIAGFLRKVTTTLQTVSLSTKHHDAVNRQRRIVVQYDAWGQLGLDFQQWLNYCFNYIDDPGSPIDSVWWDITALGYATYSSKVLEAIPQAGLNKWRE